MGHRECLVGALTISLPPEIDLRNLPARRVVVIPTELTRATIFHSTSRMTNQETRNEDRTNSNAGCRSDPTGNLQNLPLKYLHIQHLYAVRLHVVYKRQPPYMFRLQIAILG